MNSFSEEKHPRNSAGSPSSSGGQFAEKTYHDADVSLTGAAPDYRAFKTSREVEEAFVSRYNEGGGVDFMEHHDAYRAVSAFKSDDPSFIKLSWDIDLMMEPEAVTADGERSRSEQQRYVTRVKQQFQDGLKRLREGGYPVPKKVV